MDLVDEPQTLTIEEAAKVLRIGRTAAYALAREWRATNGRSGLPVLELGRTLRVPRRALQAMLSGGLPPLVDSAPAVAARFRRAETADQTRLWSESADRDQ